MEYGDHEIYTVHSRLISHYNKLARPSPPTIVTIVALLRLAFYELRTGNSSLTLNLYAGVLISTRIDSPSLIYNFLEGMAYRKGQGLGFSSRSMSMAMSM